MTNTLYVKAYGQYLYDSDNTRMAAYIFFSAPDFYQVPTTSALPIEFAGSDNPSALPYPRFISIATAIAYYSATQATALVSQVNTTIGTAYYTAYDVEIIDSAVLSTFNSLATVAKTGSYTDLSSKPTIPAAQVSSDWNAVSGVSQILNKPTIPSVITPTYNNPTRTLNSAFQVSTTQATEVSYSVDISCSMSLTGGQSGTVVLEYADDSGFTTNVKTVAKGTNSNSGTLTIGLALVQIGTSTLAGRIPIAKYVRLRTVNNTSTPTFTLQNSQEVLI